MVLTELNLHVGTVPGQHVPSQPSANGNSRPENVGRTFTTDAQGNVRMMGGGPKAQQSNSTQNNGSAAGDNKQQPSEPSQHSKPTPPQASSQNSASKVPPEQPQANGSNGHKPKHGAGSIPVFSSKLLVPRPFQLKCVSLGPTMVDLEWKLVTPVAVSRPIPVSTYAFELSWRDRSVNLHAQVWESSKKLISGNQCRKKNLTSGATYDFRVRAVEELAGGMLGGRSEWSEVLNVCLKQAQGGVPAASSASSSGHSFSYASNSSVSSNSGKGTYTSARAANQQTASQTKSTADAGPRRPQEESSVSEESIEEDEEGADEVAEEVEEELPLYSNVNAARSVDVETETPRSPTRHAWKQRSPDVTTGKGADAAVHSSHTEIKTETKLKARNASVEETRYSHEETSSENEEWRPNKAREKAKEKHKHRDTKKESPAGKQYIKKTNGQEEHAGGQKDARCDNVDKSKRDSKRDSKSKRQSWNRKVDVWQQLFDEAGHAYYYNAETQESKWEAPEWVEEVDAESGARYPVLMNLLLLALFSHYMRFLWSWLL